MTSSFRHAVVLAALLIGAGFSVFFYKTGTLGYPIAPGGTADLWNVEIFLQFEGRDEPARLEAFIPTGSANREVSGEAFYNGAFGLNLEDDPAISQQTGARNRRAVWTYRFPSNRKALRYAAKTVGEDWETPLPNAFRTLKTGVEPFEADTVKRQAFIVWVSELRRRSADDSSFASLALKDIFETATPGESEEGARGRSPARGADELPVLLRDLPERVAGLELARRTLNSEGIPARIANGVFLVDGLRRADVQHWLEYHADGRDYRYFPSGEPNGFLTIWHGPAPFVDATGVDDLDVQVSMTAQKRAASALASQAGREHSWVAQAFSFDALPLTTQLVYQVLVTIPVGVMILVFLRQFVGVKTLGTFMPVLIGIAFRETALLNGILLFSLLISLGLALRFYLERLQLLLVPRLAVVLIFIVIVMAGVTIAMTDANQSIGLSISLFPMVIIAMTIERMSILWEETSAGEAIRHGLGSLFVASVTYLAMTNERIEYVFYTFPELLLPTMAVCLLMGRYTGLRLSEIWRFRALARA
ncbi:MAG: UUP1 family membrane protein [Parvularculaceae bacterium]